MLKHITDTKVEKNRNVQIQVFFVHYILIFDTKSEQVLFFTYIS